jgi:carboxypeptidase-like protein
MLFTRFTFVVALAVSTTVACAHPSVRNHVVPAGPGLLDGRPAQEPGTYRVVGWVLSDHTGGPVGEASIVVDGTSIGTRTDDYGRYILSNIPANRNTIVVRLIGYEAERRILSRKDAQGLYACPTAGCNFRFTDTLNFWLHRRPSRIGIVPPCGLTIVAADKGASDCAGLRPALLSSSLAAELRR